MSPLDDTFISGSLDDTIRLWDLRSNACQGLLRRKGRSCVAFDPQGLVFAAAVDNNSIKLYDLHSFDKGPFVTFQVDHPRLVEWQTIKFSNDGKFILLSTSENIFLVDAFTGVLKETYQNGTQLLEASFSPDAKYVLAGSEDGNIHVWQTESGKEIALLQGHSSSVGVVQWNPKTMMIASGCTNLVFWIPADLESIDS